MTDELNDALTDMTDVSLERARVARRLVVAWEAAVAAGQLTVDEEAEVRTLRFPPLAGHLE